MFGMSAKEVQSFFSSLLPFVWRFIPVAQAVVGWMNLQDAGNAVALCWDYFLACVCVVDFGVSVFMLIVITLGREGFSWGWGCTTVLTGDINMRSCLNVFCKEPEQFQ